MKTQEVEVYNVLYTISQTPLGPRVINEMGETIRDEAMLSRIYATAWVAEDKPASRPQFTPDLLINFDHISQVREALELVDLIMLKGDIPHPHPPLLRDWLIASGLDDRQRLLVITTVFPARVAYSAALWLLRRDDSPYLR